MSDLLEKNSSINNNLNQDGQSFSQLSENNSQPNSHEIKNGLQEKSTLKVKIKELFRFERGRPKHLKSLLLMLVVIILIALGGVTAAKRYTNYTAEPGKTSIFVKQPSKNKKTAPQTVAALLDGTPVSLELSNRHPLAIMVENHPDARPQSGLEKASIVYEVAVEGGITRYLAIFGPTDAETIGPVRSARTYFIDWVSEYNAFYVHAGGSENGLKKIVSDKILDLNHANYPNKAFWRQPKPGVASEHTLYTDTKKLREVAEITKGWSKEGDFTPWKFKDDLSPDKRPSSSEVTINFSSPTYKVVYTYEPKSNTYLRSLASLNHKDAISGNVIKPKNIAIQKVKRNEVQSGGKTVGEITTVGSGEAIVYLDGKKIVGTWSKKTNRERTLFYDENNQEIKFNPGQTFIEVIDPSSTIIDSINSSTCSLNEASLNSTCSE